MDLLVAILLFVLLMSGLTYAGYRQFARSGKIIQQLGAPVASGAAIVLEGSAPQPSAVVKIIQQIGERLPVSSADAGSVRKNLIMAGYRGQHASSVFAGIRIVLAVGFFFAALPMRSYMPDNTPFRILMLAFTTYIGFFLPGFYLKKLIAKRQEILRLSLPDALDLMVVSIEAGLGLDQAMQHVAKELEPTHRELSDEMTLLTLEMRAGKRRSEALRNMAERTGEPEIQKLMAILIQNDRFGTSMAESLRTHSDFMRVRRRQEAEERAAKVGVKLVFPIFFFILPSMVVVAAGPGLLQVFKNLFPMMQNFNG
jgi:tight adherence protein C